VAGAWCLGVGGRLGWDGATVDPVTEDDLARLAAALGQLRPQAVAINLLFSSLDDRWERAVAAALPPEVFCARSSEVLPLAGEYERGIATWLNASLGPVVAGYLGRLTRGLPGARVSVMQSSGETIAAEHTARHAVRLLLSGPAGGLAGAARVAAAGATRLLTFDMGGTSTDGAAIEGAPRLTTSGRIAGFPVHLPMVDMHTVGAGGGSIARVDEGGMLLVGPGSAGADPGPACYGRGGRDPTVTDANLVLGRLDPEGFLGGRMALDTDAARAALAPLAGRLGVTIEEAALGVVEVANAHMARALRVISVERGLDPREMVLTAFGGAGGLHMCALAQALGMRRALAPVHAGVLSALGMVVAPRGRTRVRAWPGILAHLAEAAIAETLGREVAAASDDLRAEGLAPEGLTVETSLDLRYLGQSETLNTPWRGIARTLDDFHAAHASTFGHRLALDVELVSLRVRVRTRPGQVPLAEVGQGRRVAGPPRRRAAYGHPDGATLVTRGDLRVDIPIAGPAIVADAYATTWIAAGWSARLDGDGNLWLGRDLPP
jgi:N-methylhydantoinase A